MVHAFIYLVHLLSLAWVLFGLTLVSAWNFHFLDSHGVVGFILG